jgi:hypothetical protein
MMPAVVRRASESPVAALIPLALLLVYATVFAVAALGVSPIAYDDHPGQLYRLWHVVTLGPAPWAWNWGWWTGYPELQFYPPAFAYVGALVHTAALGALDVGSVYQALVWLTYVAPGVTAWLALSRAVGSGWLALPGAFLALTLSLWPVLTSGVEGGVHVGMVTARLAWALLPLLVATLIGWADGVPTFPARSVVPLVGLVALTHPAHLPSAVVIVALAALAGPARTARMAKAVGWLAVAALATAFWTVPLLVRLADTRALAWGGLTSAGLRDAIIGHPLVVVLGGLAIAAVVLARGGGERVIARLPWAMALVVAADAALLEPAGLAWLPAGRVLDGFWLALVLAGGLGAARALAWGDERFALPGALGSVLAVAASVGLSLAGHDTLTLWPRVGAWPPYAALERGLRLPVLWETLRGAPPGRVLFVRSGIPLVYRREWWRPHTHVTALTPQFTGRAIVNGTFTHPSPIAALVYRGDAGPAPIAELVERLDGQSLFGRPLESLDAETFNDYARRLRVSVVVALDEDAPRLPALADNRLFSVERAEPPFVVWSGPAAALPHPSGPGRWRIALDAREAGWTSAGLAYYPLWRASTPAGPVETRRGALGDLEVKVPGGPVTLELSYGPGGAEWSGVALSSIGLLAWLGLAWRPGVRA